MLSAKIKNKQTFARTQA